MQELPDVHISDAFVGVSGKLIFAHDYLGVVVGDGEEVSEFPVNRNLVGLSMQWVCSARDISKKLHFNKCKLLCSIK